MGLIMENNCKSTIQFDSIPWKISVRQGLILDLKDYL